MARLDEEKMATEFIERLSTGFYSYDRSVNTEVDYASSKEERDTKAVHDSLNSPLFDWLKKNND